MKRDLGASAMPTGLGAPEGAEPDTRLGATPAIPSAWTPGPWKVGGEWPQCIVVYDSRCIPLVQANTGIGADWIDCNPLGRDVAAANARLIAAAPDLYDALSTARKALDGNHVFNVSREYVLAILDEALAKARGKDAAD